MFPFTGCRSRQILLATRPWRQSVDTPLNLPTPTPSFTRRRWITGATVASAASPSARATSWAATSNGLSHNAEAIHQETVFKASPQRIYDALLDARQFQKVELLSGAMKGTDLKPSPQRSVANQAAHSASLATTSSAGSSSLCPTSASSRHGVRPVGTRASIPLFASN